jgi:RHS repeat-associated protein
MLRILLKTRRVVTPFHRKKIGNLFQYQYGTFDAIYGWTLVQVDDLEGDNTRWSTQHNYNRNGFPIDIYDSFKWHKNYAYNYPLSGGDPTTFSPSSVSYFRTGSGNSHAVYYFYDAGNRFNYKRNDYFDTITDFDYDPTSGILSKIQYRSKPGVLGFPTIDFNFTRDNSGLIKSITGFTDSIKDKELSNVDYTNDLEITSVQHTLPQPFNETYTYDTRGNRLTSPNQTYTYNSLNRLISTGTHTYEYDADGNMTKETNTVTGEIKQYFFNSENRLYQYKHYPNATSPADKIATYKYDLYGRRLRKTVDGVVTNFFWEDDNMAMELDVGLNPIRRYIYGAGKDDVESYVEYSELTDPNTGQGTFNTEKKGRYSFVKDQVGTIHKVYSHQNEQFVELRDYDTFGNRVNGTTISAGNLGFQSKYYDQESGLYYFYHRYYHPVNGRFMNEDPIKFEGGINFYAGFNNNPVMNLDPYGLINKRSPWHPPGGRGPKCYFRDLCETLRWKIWTFEKMIRSHIGWDKHVPPPRGGDKHAEDISGFKNALEWCKTVYTLLDCEKKLRDKKKDALKCGVVVVTAFVILKVGKMIVGWFLAGPPGVMAGAAL